MFSVFTGTLFSSVILSKLLKVHDALIGIIAAFWDAVVALIYIFALQNWQLYLGKKIYSIDLNVVCFLKVDYQPQV